MNDAQPLPRGRHKLSRERIREAQYRRLVQATLAEVGEHGYRRASVARIIRRAGVSRSTFYEFFDDRADCFRAAFEYLLSDLDSALAPERKAETAECVADRLNELRRRFRSCPGSARVLFAASMVSGPEIARLQLETTDRWSDWLDEACRRALKSGASPTPPCDQRARMALGAALEVAFHEEAGPDEILKAATMPYLSSSAAGID